MKAIVIDAFGGPEKMELREIEKPRPTDVEVLIKVAYAGVNPVDWKIREGYLKERLPHEFPLILGWDVAGIVVEIGKEVQGFKIGDEVYSYVRKPLVKWGAYAEYVAFDAKDVAKKPKNISFAEAAAMPVICLTAWQSIFDAAHLKKGETILILGGSGGVGSMAIQFAKSIGAKVIATASSKKHEYIKQLGADIAVDYRDNFAGRFKEGVDVLLDGIGGELFRKCLSCLKKGGRSASLLEQIGPEETKALGIQAEYVFVNPSGQELKAISELIEEKKVRPPPIVEMSLKEAAEAIEKLHAGEVLGKIVLKVT